MWQTKKREYDVGSSVMFKLLYDNFEITSAILISGVGNID